MCSNVNLLLYQDGDGGDDSEGCESDETEPIDDHGRELPVADDFNLLYKRSISNLWRKLQKDWPIE